MTKDVKPSLIKALELLQPYRNVAAGLRVFVESSYADDKTIQQLMDFIQSNLKSFRLSTLGKQQSETVTIQTSGDAKKEKDIEDAEQLLRSLNPEGLEQNLDVDKDNAIEGTEIRDVLPHMTSKEWKKFAESLSANPELQKTMKKSCETIVADMKLKIKNGDKLTPEDIELFQLSIFILGKNTDVIIDGVITPGKLTEQLIKEIHPEYFRVRELAEWFGPECKVNLNGLWNNLSVSVRNTIYEKLGGYKQKLVSANVKEENQQNILYSVFAQGVNSQGKFDDAEWFVDLDERIAKVQKQVDVQNAEEKRIEIFQQQQQKITKIGKDTEGLSRQIVTLDIRISIEQDAYQVIYDQLAEALEANNSLREKIKTVSSYGLAAAASPIGPYIVGLRGKPTPDANELLQIELYTRLTQQFQVISNFQAKKKEVISTFDVRGLEQQCLYYESLRDIGSKDRAEQALVNLITEHGQPIRTKYASDIQKLKGTASGTTLAILNVDKPTLQTIVKEKQREIDIAQQVLSGAKAEWGGSTVGSLQHLSQEQIHRIIGNEGKQYARLTGSMVEVRDNTATQIKIQTQQDVVANGNIVGSKKAYETIGGSTSTASNIIYAEYSAATQYFKTLTLPGMGKINVLIDPEFYSQIISYAQTGKQLTYDPVYNTELQCFEIEPGRVFMAQMDKAGAISYSAWGNLDTSPIIHRKEYQSLLQAKQGMNALVTQQQPIIDLKNYKDQLETTAGQIQQLAGLYSQTPGDESLSNAIIQDLTKPGGLKKKLEGLKDMITENGKYLSLIAELRRNTSGVYDRYEQELHQMETMLASLPQFVEQLDGLLNYSIWENADSRAIKEFAIMVVAVVGGVLLAIASGGLASGVSAMVISAAAGTAGGMIASRVGQEFFANTTDTGGLTNDLHSDIGKCMLGQAKWGDVMPRVGMEFAQGTATTLMFMGAGRIIGQQLEKFVTANAGNTSWEVRLAHKTRKAISKLNDNEIQLLDKKGFGKFIAKVGGELKEEFGQEGVQQGADKVDSRLGGLVSIITSITGKTQYRAGKVDVFIEGSEKIAGFESPATVVSYKGETGEFQGLIANNLKESGYILHSSNNGELIYVRTVNGKPEALKFAPTFESTTIKEIDLAEHAKLYGIRFLQENTQADKDGNYHYDYTDFEVGKNNLMNYLARNGMVLDGPIAEDGSFVVIAKNGERVIFTKRDLVAEQLEIEKQKLDTDVDEAQESQLDPNRDREKVKQNMDAKNASRAEIQRVCLSLGIDFDALDPETKKQVYNLINKVHKRVGNDYDGAIGESGDIGVLQITKDGIRAKILALRGLKQLLNIDDNLTSRLTKALMREGICGATNNDQSVDIDPEADEMIGVETDAIMTEIESELTQAEATQTPLPEGKDSLLVAKLSKIVVNLSSLIKKIGISPKLIQVVQRKVVEMVQLIHRIQSRSPGWAERNLSGPATQEFIQLLAKNYGVLGIAVATVAVIANWIYNRLDATLHISLDPKKNRIILSVDAYGRKVYADAEGNDLPIETAWRLHNMHDQAVHKICGGSDYVVKGSFHVTTARMLPSDRDVSRPPAAINKMTDSLIDEDGQVIANPSLNGQDIQNVKFRDKSGGDFPTEIKPPFNKQTLHDLSEKGLLKISCDVTMQDAATGANATLEHEFFAENGSGVFDILDSDGNPIGGLIVVDGVNHGSIFAADKYNRALIMSDIKQLTQGDTQDKGKLAKRIANYLQVKGTANRQLIPDRILSHTPQFITVRLEKYGWIINSKTAYEKLRNELLADEDLGLDEHVIPSREDIQQTKKRKPITEPYFVTTVRDIQKRVLAGDITPQREIDAMLGENGFDFTSLAGIGYIVQLKLLQQICSDKRQSTMQQLDDQAPVMEYETAINDLLKKESITDQEKIVIENGPFKKLWDEFTNNPKGEKFKSRTNRLQIAQDLLAQSGEAIQLIDENGNPTEQARQIIFAHLIESNLGTVKYLKQAGFTDKQILVLCDNKVCGMDQNIGEISLDTTISLDVLQTEEDLEEHLAECENNVEQLLRSGDAGLQKLISGVGSVLDLANNLLIYATDDGMITEGRGYKNITKFFMRVNMLLGEIAFVYPDCFKQLANYISTNELIHQFTSIANGSTWFYVLGSVPLVLTLYDQVFKSFIQKPVVDLGIFEQDKIADRVVEINKRAKQGDYVEIQALMINTLRSAMGVNLPFDEAFAKDMAQIFASDNGEYNLDTFYGIKEAKEKLVGKALEGLIARLEAQGKTKDLLLTNGLNTRGILNHLVLLGFCGVDVLNGDIQNKVRPPKSIVLESQVPITFTEQQINNNNAEMDEIVRRQDFQAITNKISLFTANTFNISGFYVDTEFAQEFAAVYANEGLTVAAKQFQFNQIWIAYGQRLSGIQGPKSDMILHMIDIVGDVSVRGQFIDAFMKGGLSGKVHIEESGEVKAKKVEETKVRLKKEAPATQTETTISDKIAQASDSDYQKIKKEFETVTWTTFRDGTMDSTTMQSWQNRLQVARELLGVSELTAEQELAIIRAHLVPEGRNVQKGKILRDAGLSEEQARVLMENNVCGFLSDIKQWFQDVMIDRFDIDSKLADFLMTNYNIDVTQLRSYGNTLFFESDGFTYSIRRLKRDGMEQASTGENFVVDIYNKNTRTEQTYYTNGIYYSAANKGLTFYYIGNGRQQINLAFDTRGTHNKPNIYGRNDLIYQRGPEADTFCKEYCKAKSIPFDEKANIAGGVFCGYAMVANMMSIEGVPIGKEQLWRMMDIGKYNPNSVISYGGMLTNAGVDNIIQEIGDCENMGIVNGPMGSNTTKQDLINNISVQYYCTIQAGHWVGYTRTSDGNYIRYDSLNTGLSVLSPNQFAGEMIEKAGYVAGYGKKTVSQVSINRPKKSVAVVPKKSVNTVKPARTLVTITDSKPIDNGPIGSIASLFKKNNDQVVIEGGERGATYTITQTDTNVYSVLVTRSSGIPITFRGCTISQTGSVVTVNKQGGVITLDANNIVLPLDPPQGTRELDDKKTDPQTRSQERQVATQAKEKLFMENKQNRDGMTPLGAEYALQDERQRTMSEAERVLGFVPSAEQQEVIRQAHMVGYGEADANGNVIGVDPEIKYTQGQKTIKARIMKESGLFSDAETLELGNQGVIGFADRFAAAINRFVEPIINGFNEKGEVMQNGSIYNDVIIGKKRQFRLSAQDKDYITLFVGADGNLRIESPANRLFVKANERYDIGTSSPSSGVRNAFGFSDEVPGVMMKVKFDGQKISIQGLEGHTEYVGSLPFDPLAIVENQASGPLMLDGQELSEGAVLYPHNGGAPVTVQAVESDSVTILNADGTTTEYLPDAVSDYFTIHTNPEPEPDPVTNSPDNPLVRSEDGGVIQKGMWYEMPVGTMESIGDQPFAFQLIEDRIAVRVGPAEWLPGKDKDGNIVYQFDKGQNIPSLRRVDEQTGAVRWLHIIYSEDGRVFAQYIKMEAQSQIPIETAPVPLAVETQKPNSADLRQYPYQESSGPLYGQKGEWSNGSEIKFTDENGTDRVYQVVIRDGMYYVKELDRRGRLGDERSLSKAELNELGERHGSHPELDKIQFEAVPSRRPNRSTQHQEVPQVRRDANVVSIFDTYGNLDACKSNLRSQGCTDANGNWIGGNTVLTMHGDILGDRFKGGLATYRYLAQLKSQAQTQGGDVVILLGNHEFSFIAYLMNEGQVLFDDDGVSEQFEGIYDLAEFNEGHTPGVEDGGDILENMKNDRQGLFDLNFIAGAQIFEYVDDTLQVHANPNQYIIHTLIRASTRPDGTIDLGYGVDAINAYLQNGLKQFLLGENHNIDKEEFTTFMLYLTDMNTERVSTYSPEHYRILHDAGVNRITHGHSLGKEVLPNTHQSKHYDIEIIDGDREHGFPGSDVGDQNRNALTIDRGGSVFVGWNQDGQ